MSSVFIVVPAYNEAPAIRATLEPLLRAGYEIVVVDDCSTDGTAKELETIPVHRLRHPINLGQGAALETGKVFALSRGAEYIVHFDADGQHRPDSIEPLLAPLKKGEADVTLGSRFLRKEDAAAVPAVKRVLLWFAIWVNWILTGVRLTDAHNGMRAFTRAAAEKVRITANRYDHATEILAELRRLGLRYVEVATRIEYTEYARSKGQPIWNSLNIVIDDLLRKVLR